jgi:protein-tyrosine phosphatase
VALTLVSLSYVALGPVAFQKQGGWQSVAASALLVPYTVGAWVNSRLWTRSHPHADAVIDGISIGRMPTAGEFSATHFNALVDLSAELPGPVGKWHHYGLPWLDLVAPTTAQLRAAVQCIEAARSHGEVLVCCALGYSRSATAVAAWLLASDRAPDVDAAIAVICASRRGVIFHAEHRRALVAWRSAAGDRAERRREPVSGATP